MAMIIRKKNQYPNIGVPIEIQGHPWFKWVDSAIEQSDLNEVMRHLAKLYEVQKPVGPTTNGGAAKSSSINTWDTPSALEPAPTSSCSFHLCQLVIWWLSFDEAGPVLRTSLPSLINGDRFKGWVEFTLMLPSKNFDVHRLVLMKSNFGWLSVVAPFISLL